MPDYALYKLKVSTLTPLHIGSGTTLLHEYDFAMRDKKTWRVNDAALFAEQTIDDPRMADQLARTPPARLIKENEFVPDSPFFRYILDGEPRSGKEGAQLREQLKNTHDQPYLPGSTLKGSLRTVLGWYAWEKLGLRPDQEDLYQEHRNGDVKLRPAKFVGQEYEHRIFVQNNTQKGKEANYDMMKSVQVADSAPCPPDTLMVANTQVILQEGNLGSPVEVEAIRPDVTFETTLKMDWVLFSDWAKHRGLRLPGKVWLEHLPEVANAHARQHIDAELKWFENVAGAKPVAGFYRQLKNVSLPPNSFLLQTGWGTGWDNITFGSRLQADEEFMETIISEYRLSIGERGYGDPFPASRHVTVKVRVDEQADKEFISFKSPLGWVLVEMSRGA